VLEAEVAYKPGDFFLGVIDFFGILVPGAVLMYLHGDRLLALLGGQRMLDSQVSRWAAFLIGAFVLGQFLLGASVPLNRLVDFFWPESNDSYYRDVKYRIKPPRESGSKKRGTVALNRLLDFFLPFWPEPKRKAASKRTATYYRAYSYVRLHSAAAITEIDRQTAEYKLFRGLTLVFLLDFPLAWINGSLDWSRAAVMGLMLALALWRFLFLLRWARRLTFELCDLILKEPPAVDKA
jgi:hypothetical protein